MCDSRITSKSHLTKVNERKNTVDVGSQIALQRPLKYLMAPKLKNDLSAHSQVSVIDDNHNLLSIMARQNEISALLAQQLNISHLPKREFQVFDGNPIHAFPRAFEHNVEEKTDDFRDCLHFLAQHTRRTTRACSKLSTNACRQRISKGKGFIGRGQQDSSCGKHEYLHNIS